MGRRTDPPVRELLSEDSESIREGARVIQETARKDMGSDAVRNLTKAERVSKFGEVFTPQWVVDLMCDNLPQDAFEPESTFLEPTCGEGVFVVEILRRKFERCKKRADFTTALESVYAMELLPDNVQITICNVKALCCEYFNPTKAEFETIENHVIQADALKVMRMINDMNERERRASQCESK